MAKRTPKTRTNAALRKSLEVETPRMRKAVEATRPETVARWAQEAAEPRQWSWPSERRLIGRRIPRLDGPDKAPKKPIPSVPAPPAKQKDAQVASAK